MNNEIVLQDNAMMSLIESVDINQISNTLDKITGVQVVVQKSLKPGHDYDTIPGTSKPTLLKPGAEKILMLFGLTSEYEIVEKIEDYDKGIFAYTIKCILSKNGQKITEGVGSCNSKEDKYRYRWVKESDVPSTVDKDVLKTKTTSYGATLYRIENDEIYSQANTILKIAKKRAQIDATLTVASLSELFTQDIEDMKEFIQSEQMETMDITSAQNIKITFGKKHKGETLGEVFKKDKGYIEWLAAKAHDEVTRKACNILLSQNKDNNNRASANDEPDDFDIPADVGFQPIGDDETPF